MARGTAGGSIGVTRAMQGVPPGKPRRVTASSGTGLAGGTGRAGGTCGVTCPRPGPAQATRIRGTRAALRHPSGISGAPHLPPDPSAPHPPRGGPTAAAGAHVPRQVMAEQGEEDREYREYRRLEDCEEDSPAGEEEEEQLLLHVTEGPTGTGVPSGEGSRVPMGCLGSQWVFLGPWRGAGVPGGGAVPHSHLTPLRFPPRLVAPHQGPGQFLHQDILAQPLAALWGTWGNMG